MQKKQDKNIIICLLVMCCGRVTLFFPKIFGARRYYLRVMVFCLCALGRLAASFEKSRPDALKLQLIAVICRLAVAGRAVFAGVPFVKPVAALVIIAGASLGPLPGFVRGAISMLSSNFIFGQGPWTVWQMLSFGLCGLLAGLVFYRRDRLKKPALMAVFGFLEYLFVSGPILDISGIYTYSIGKNMAVTALLVSGFSVNLTARRATFLFLLALARPIMNKLDRIITKYGL